MIIDSNLVFSDNAALKTGQSEAVGLTSLFKPGLARIPLFICITKEDAAVTKLIIRMQQADTKGGDYEDVSGASIELNQADLKQGSQIGWHYLPANVTKPWIKLDYTVTGGDSGGQIFAALTREESI